MLRLRLRKRSPRVARGEASSRHSLGVVVALAVAAGLTLLPALAGAAVWGCREGTSWVRVEVERVPPEFARRVLEDLRAGLAGSRVGACAEDSPPTRPLAIVRVAPSARKPSLYVIDVSDAVTQKRLGRDVDLSRVPPDGRAFAIAVAAEELLRASWAELALRERKRSKTSAAPAARTPAAPREASTDTPASSSGDTLAARLALEHFAHGQTQYGGDVAWSRPLSTWLGFTLALGLRKGLDAESQHGSIRSSTVALELALEPRLVAFGAISLHGTVGLRGARVNFTGVAAGAALERQAAGLALYARSGLALLVAPAGAFRARTSLGLGAPLQAFSASDGGERVTGMGGLELFASTGIGVEF
jgi:hypothetical protein